MVTSSAEKRWKRLRTGPVSSGASVSGRNRTGRPPNVSSPPETTAGTAESFSDRQVGALRAEFRRQAPGLERFCTQIGETIAAGTFEQELPELFRNQPKISIDYAVMEHARFIAVAESRFDWDDVGSWTSLRNHFATDADGNVADGLFAAVDSRNLVISGSPDHLIAAIGVDNLVIVQTRDVTLVCAANQAQRIKELLKAVGLRPELRHFL